MRRFGMSVVVLSFFLVGCATNHLPQYAASSTVLVVPKFLKNSSSESWIRRYRLVLSSGDDEYDVWLSNSKEPYQIVEDLPAGSYTIEAIKWRVGKGWRAHTAMGEGLVIDSTLALINGAMTIFPYTVILEQSDRGGSIRSNYGVSPLTEKEESVIRRGLQQSVQGRQWLETTPTRGS